MLCPLNKGTSQPEWKYTLPRLSPGDSSALGGNLIELPTIQSNLRTV